MYSLFFKKSYTLQVLGGVVMLDSVIVGQVIQRFREQKKQSQELISGFAGIGRTHLSAIERGERKPTLETLFKIADALDVKPSIIIAAIEQELEKKKRI
jgi:transcriptional regulator with XRE-family HTH domain